MDALLQSAIVHQRAGRWAEAEQTYRQILQAQPRHATGWFEYANLLAATGRVAEAASAYRNAIASRPDFAEAYCNLGNATQLLGDLESAKTAFEHAVQLRPNFPEAWNNLGNIAQDQGDAAGAISKHHKAIELRPDFVQAWYSSGGAYRSLGRLDEALEAYDRALALQPAFEKAQVNRAGVLRDMGRQQDAIDALHRAMEIHSRPETLSNLIYALPMHPAYDAATIWPLLKRWNTEFAEPLAGEIQAHTNDRTPDRRLRVGYVSPDFNFHPVGRFTLPLLENHDRAQFEVFCYSDSKLHDNVTDRLRASADLWCDATKLSDAQLAQKIREDRIDILVDQAAHLAGNRLFTFARNPAPVQVTWLSYPGSTGLRTIDYRFSDPYLDPPGDQRFYSEQTIELPDCYWCYDPPSEKPIEVVDLPAASARFITFGSLNNFAKISEDAIDLWARVMQQTLSSRLMLLGPKGTSQLRFEHRMASHGIGRERIDWLDRMPRPQYMETYRRIDIVLDTFPYNGHTTTFDAIWMGVPVMTLAGKTAVSRGGLSVLSNLRLHDWIARGADEFVRQAVKMAGDLPRLIQLRRTLRPLIEGSALMDKPRFARGVEAAYRKIWRGWCENG